MTNPQMELSRVCPFFIYIFRSVQTFLIKKKLNKKIINHTHWNAWLSYKTREMSLMKYICESFFANVFQCTSVCVCVCVCVCVFKWVCVCMHEWLSELRERERTRGTWWTNTDDSAINRTVCQQQVLRGKPSLAPTHTHTHRPVHNAISNLYVYSWFIWGGNVLKWIPAAVESTIGLPYGMVILSTDL